METNTFFNKIDWKLLKEQKSDLLETIENLTVQKIIEKFGNPN